MLLTQECHEKISNQNLFNGKWFCLFSLVTIILKNNVFLPKWNTSKMII